MEIQINTAQMSDASEISAVLSANWADRSLFQESASGIARNISEFVVARDETGRIVGCAGVHRDSAKLAQLYSIAVVPQRQGSGVGGKLISAALRSAASLGAERLWVATMKPDYFSRYGFRPISRWELPISVLFQQFRKTLRQPPELIVRALTGRFTVVVCDL